MQSQEFSIRARALPAFEVLKSATVNAAKLLKMEGQLGCIRPGAIADLLILKSNPLADLRVLDDMEGTGLGIIKDGRVVMSKITGLEVDAVYS